MPVTTTPFLLKRVSLTLVKSSEIGTGTAVEYKCTLNQAKLTPSAGGGGASATYETFCETFDAGSASSNATWALDLNGMQNYQAAEDLSLLLFENEGEKYTFTLIPDNPAGDGAPSATSPGFTGEITATPTEIGGTANQYATFTVSLPVVGKPTKVVAPPAPLAADAEDETGEGASNYELVG